MSRRFADEAGERQLSADQDLSPRPSDTAEEAPVARSASEPGFPFRVSLIVPTMNEAAGARSLLSDVPAWIDEVIVVDGPSTDGTLDVVGEVCPRSIRLTQRGEGKGGAIKEGLAASTGDIIVTMDGDLSMSLVDAGRLVSKLLEGFDFVKGSRSLPGGGSADFTPARRFGSWALTKVAAMCYGTPYTDITYGFNAYWRLTIVDPSTLSDGFEFEVQAAIRAVRGGLRTAEVGCFENARIGGESKLHAALDGWRIFRAIVEDGRPRRRLNLRPTADLYLRRGLVDPRTPEAGPDLTAR